MSQYFCSKFYARAPCPRPYEMSSQHKKFCTFMGQRVVPRFAEFCYCSFLPLLPGFACNIHATLGPPFSRALYIAGLAAVSRAITAAAVSPFHSSFQADGGLARSDELPEATRHRNEGSEGILQIGNNWRISLGSKMIIIKLK